jgi:hypothetical protein
LNSLQKNNLFEKSKVLIFSDGPKNEIDKGKIYKVRELLKKKLIPKNSEIIENNFNLGLSRNIIEGITKTLKIYDSVIILEDDLEVSPYFLNYMNDALNLYANSKNVSSISGYMYPIKPKKFSNSYFFLNFIESWGWGTWNRAWNNFEKNSAINCLKKYPNQWWCIYENCISSSINQIKYYPILFNEFIIKKEFELPYAY